MSKVIHNDSNSNNKIHPKKFGLYLAFTSIIMMFAGLTSAYIVRQAAGNWLEFRLPDVFFISTGVIILSSITLHWSYRSFLSGKPILYKALLFVSGILGLLFIVLQYIGWTELTANGVDLKGNPAGSFIYVISGLHAAHVLGGVGAIAVAIMHAYGLKYRITPMRKLRFELTLQYWHFVDILWIYLIVFFVLVKS